MASLIDATEKQTYYLLKVNGNEPDVPELQPRPGQKAFEPEAVSLAGLSSFLNS